MPEPLVIESSLRTYRVEFDGGFADRCRRLAGEGAFFVVDAAVDRHFGDDIADAVPAERRVILEASEEVKTLDGVKSLALLLSDRGVRRGQMLVAVGGGVIQDVAAFTASILYRGVAWVFLPTTLLAQADSCIGGKTSINVGERKNLVGNFNPPAWIHIDAAFLATLPDVEIRSGIGEILHYYVFGDSALLEPLIRDYDAILADRTLLAPHVQEALRIKRDVIRVDEFDRGIRNHFNYGHTFGHALESITDFKLRHGQAVTVGMCLANELSEWLGLTDRGTVTRVNELLRVNLPDYPWDDLDPDRYMELLSRDKKNVDSSTLTCILMEAPGRLTKRSIPMDGELRTRIREFFNVGLPKLVISRSVA